MAQILLIRHGQTEGNLEKRYIGVTDEPLCPQGIRTLEKKRMPDVQAVYVSPLLRCRQSAQILFAHKTAVIVPDFRESDFGRFEGKNYQELSADPLYQAWIDSQGTLPFPEGEAPDAFKARCVRAFEQVAQQIVQQGIDSAALVVHGGTIMAILERFGWPQKPFYDWHVPNGGGYRASLTPQGLLMVEGAL